MRRGQRKQLKTPAPDIGQRPVWQEKRWLTADATLF
jgi:hypothetical protein